MANRGERGLAAKSLVLLERALAIVENGKPMTVRGTAYKLFVKDMIASMAKTEVTKVGRLLVYARERNLIEWAAIVDESRSLEQVGSWADLQSFARTVARAYRRDLWAGQASRVLVLSEKATVGGVIRPVTEALGVPFMAVHGFGSATALHDLAEASADDDRTTVILYVGDHDPSGMFMSEADMPERLARYGGRVEVRRIALVAHDVPSLPSFPANPKDPRFRWYMERYGVRAWELDAMDENDLRARIENEIRAYINQDAWERMRLVEADEQATVRRVAAAMAG